MAMYLIGYSIILLVVAFVVFSILVKKKIIFGNTIGVQRIFANPLLHYSLRRILSAIITITLAIIVTFFLIRAAKPADQYCLEHFNDPKLPEVVKELQCKTWKKTMGYDGSILHQLLTFFYNSFPFPKTVCLNDYAENAAGQYVYSITDCHNAIIDFGRIYSSKLAVDKTLVSTYMVEHAGVSFKIGIFGLILDLALGYPFGLLMAKYQNKTFDKISIGVITIYQAVPGLAELYILYGILVGILHLNNAGNELPAILAMGLTGAIGEGYWVRRYMINERNADYVKFARSKGLSENRIAWVHILRNAIVPLIRGIPSAIILELTGSYYIEQMYSIPGIGSALLTASNEGNAAVLQAIVMVSAYLSVVSYLLGDIITVMFDPRISFSD